MSPSGGLGGSMPKVVIPVLVVVVLSIGILFMLWSGEKQKAGRLQQLLETSEQKAKQLEAQNQELAQQIDALQRDRKSVEDKLASLRTQFSSASSDLERSRSSLEELKDRYEKLTEERNKLQSQLASTSKERDEVQQGLKRLEQENADLERSASHLRERLAFLDRDYRKLADKVAQLESMREEDGNTARSPNADASAAPASTMKTSSSSIPGAVELPPIIVRKDQAGTSMPVRGRLVEVNEPHNFVIVDKGSVDGVRVGMTFDVLRGAGSVGRATVVRVRPQLSACDIIRSNTPGPLQAGDLVVQSGS